MSAAPVGLALSPSIKDRVRVLAPKLSSEDLRNDPMSERLARDWGGRYMYVPGVDWHAWDGGRWRVADGAEMLEATLTWARTFVASLMDGGSQQVAAAARYLDAKPAENLLKAAAGKLRVPSSHLDSHPHLLNCANGVVDLTTGELRDADPSLLLTKTTGTTYVQGYEDGSWHKALAALDEPEQEFLRLWLGQALFGLPNARDEVLVCRGGGANGKTTLLGTCQGALGEFAINVPDKVLLGNGNEHSTELMPFWGARFALMEETPEGRRLNVNMVKKIAGTERMTARAVYRDNVSWNATHSLIITTNYDLTVDETDYGTWRRLQMLPFDKSFKASPDPGLKALLRVPDGPGRRAALAWMVSGAVVYYASGELPPPTTAMRQATEAWREKSDVLAGFIAERLDVQAGRCILATDLVAELQSHLKDRGHAPWGDRTITERLSGHRDLEGADVRKVRSRIDASKDTWLSRPSRCDNVKTPKQATIWTNLAWKLETEVWQ